MCSLWLRRWSATTCLSAQIAQTEERIAATLSTLTQDSALAEPAEELPVAPTRAARERGLQAALHAVLGVDLTAIPTIGVETALTIALGNRCGPVALSHLRALLLVADAGAGHAHQRREVVEGAVGEASQPGGTGLARRREHRTSQPLLHRGVSIVPAYDGSTRPARSRRPRTSSPA